MCGKKEKAPVWQKDWCCEPVNLGCRLYYTTNVLKSPRFDTVFMVREPLKRSTLRISDRASGHESLWDLKRHQYLHNDSLESVNQPLTKEG